MTIRTIRAYTSDPAGLRVCRLGMKPTGGYGSPYWSPIDESTEVLPPLAHLVAPDERPDGPCAFTGMRLKAGAKHDFIVQRLEGEATTALDPETTQTVLKLLADINRDLGLTILLITHEMAVVRDIASHVAVIDGGRIVEQGTTYDVFADPKHSTTRSFLSGITGVTLPSFIADRLQPERPQGAAQEVIRITFAGRHATDPMLAMLTSELGIAVNILAGAIEEIGPHPFGNLLVSVEAGRGAEARAYLERHELLTEVLGYVG